MREACFLSAPCMGVVYQVKVLSGETRGQSDSPAGLQESANSSISIAPVEEQTRCKPDCSSCFGRYLNDCFDE